MRTPFVRALGVVWLAACAATVLAALLTAAVAIFPALPIPAPLTGAAMLAAAILALLATPIALAPGTALSASLAAPEGTPIWGTGRPDLWGDLARAMMGRAPPAAAGGRTPVEETAELLRQATAQADVLRQQASAAVQALAAATQHVGHGAARLDGTAQQVEARLVHALRVIEPIAAQLATLRPSDAQATVDRAASAVAAVERAAAALASTPAPEGAPPPTPDPRIEAALSTVAEALGRLVARPDPVPDIIARIDALAVPAPADPVSAGDPALPARLEAAAARLEAQAMRLEAIEPPPAPDPDLPARLDAAAARLEAIAPPPDLLGPVIAGLEEAMAPAQRAAHAINASLAIEAARLDQLAGRLEEAPGAIAAVLSAPPSPAVNSEAAEAIAAAAEAAEAARHALAGAMTLMDANATAQAGLQAATDTLARLVADLAGPPAAAAMAPATPPPMLSAAC
jgi:hypothetical protein